MIIPSFSSWGYKKTIFIADTQQTNYSAQAQDTADQLAIDNAALQLYFCSWSIRITTLFYFVSFKLRSLNVSFTMIFVL